MVWLPVATEVAEEWKRKAGPENRSIRNLNSGERKCPQAEGKRKRKGIPATNQQGKSPGLGCYSLGHRIRNIHHLVI